MRKAMVAAILLAASAVSNATPVLDLHDLYYDGVRTDFSADLFYGGVDLVTYDASDDRLTFTSQQTIPGEFYVASGGSRAYTQSSLLQWSGKVDKHGRITDPGFFSWFVDFGSGMELLANGELRKLGM